MILHVVREFARKAGIVSLRRMIPSNLRMAFAGSVASLKIRKKNAISAAGYLDLLGDESEQLSNEPDLTPNVVSLHPPNLPLPHHVYRFIALNGSSGLLKFPEALLGVDPTFDRAMVLLEDVIQVLDRSMTTAAS